MIKAQCTGFLNTPALWEGIQSDIKQFEFPSLALQSYEPQTLPQNIRLGHQVEHIYKQLLEYSVFHDLILHNLQIKNDERTLGEIDFVIRDKVEDRLVHVELTYKFYIIDTEIAKPFHQLIGPNRRDTFMMKMEKIKNVQFPLLHSPEGVKALHAISINHEDLEHQCCFKAQLYKPYHSVVTELGLLNTSCIVGYWLRLSDLENAEFTNAQFYMPSKSEWIIEPHMQVSWKSIDKIKLVIKQRLNKEYAPMIWIKKPPTELEKLFVVWW